MVSNDVLSKDVGNECCFGRADGALDNWIERTDQQGPDVRPEDEILMKVT
jgi:hypothetical protein